MGKHITSTAPDGVTPPPEAHMKFTAVVAAKLTRWINDGAVDERHWAFQTPKKSPLPKTATASPSFGEHFAASWLDASRYADTSGYSIDGAGANGSGATG